MAPAARFAPCSGERHVSGCGAVPTGPLLVHPVAIARPALASPVAAGAGHPLLVVRLPGVAIRAALSELRPLAGLIGPTGVLAMRVHGLKMSGVATPPVETRLAARACRVSVVAGVVYDVPVRDRAIGEFEGEDVARIASGRPVVELAVPSRLDDGESPRPACVGAPRRVHVGPEVGHWIFDWRTPAFDLLVCHRGMVSTGQASNQWKRVSHLGRAASDKGRRVGPYLP